MITPEMKDLVLKWLCSNLQPESYQRIDKDKLLKDSQLSFENLNSILKYFERNEFISNLNSRRVAIFLTLNLEAIDFYRKGGFVGQEELLVNNMQKLLLEIENLKKQLGPNHLDTLSKMASFASAVISGLGLLPK